MRTIYYNGIVYTGSDALQQAFIVDDNTFVYAGSTEETLALAKDADTKIDLNGAFVCSGFNDSHMHLLNYGQALLCARLDAHTDSLSGMMEYTREFLKEHPTKGWLNGRGWNQDYFTDVHRMPNRYDLDTISTEIPIMLTRCCGHAMVVNSKALEILGVTKDTPQVDGGTIVMENDEPNGVFMDNAMFLVMEKLPLPSPEMIREMIRLASKTLNSYGVTSCHSDDFSVFRGIPAKEIMEAFKELEESGELTVRVNEQSNFTSVEEVASFLEDGNNTGVGSDMFKVGPLKLLGDGSLGARTAYLSSPYEDDPSVLGFPVFSQKELDDMIGCANQNGMQVAVHAIGDACLDMVLNAIEKSLKENPRNDHRHGIVHCQISRPDQLQRIADLNLHVYAQSIFLDYDNHIVTPRVGEERASSSYNWKTLKNMGVTVSNGTDCPVELPFALGGIECIVTRCSMEEGAKPYLIDQAFTVKEALDSYTSLSAYASFDEDRKGKIAPGHLADFVILDKSPFDVEPKTIHEIKVMETYLGGKKVYSAQ